MAELDTASTPTPGLMDARLFLSWQAWGWSDSIVRLRYLQDINYLLLLQMGPESFTCKMSKELAGRTTVIGAKSWLNTAVERGFQGLFLLQL